MELKGEHRGGFGNSPDAGDVRRFAWKLNQGPRQIGFEQCAQPGRILPLPGLLKRGLKAGKIVKARMVPGDGEGGRGLALRFGMERAVNGVPRIGAAGAPAPQVFLERRAVFAKIVEKPNEAGLMENFLVGQSHRPRKADNNVRHGLQMNVEPLPALFRQKLAGGVPGCVGVVARGRGSRRKDSAGRSGVFSNVGRSGHGRMGTAAQAVRTD
jgi:hypothetical protein